MSYGYDDAYCEICQIHHRDPPIAIHVAGIKIWSSVCHISLNLSFDSQLLFLNSRVKAFVRTTAVMEFASLGLLVNMTIQ